MIRRMREDVGDDPAPARDPPASLATLGEQPVDFGRHMLPSINPALAGGSLARIDNAKKSQITALAN